MKRTGSPEEILFTDIFPPSSNVLGTRPRIPILDRKGLRKEIDDNLAKLPEDKRGIIIMQYGWEDDIPKTYMESAQQLGEDYEDVRASVRKALRELKTIAKRGYLPDFIPPYEDSLGAYVLAEEPRPGYWVRIINAQRTVIRHRLVEEEIIPLPTSESWQRKRGHYLFQSPMVVPLRRLIIFLGEESVNRAQDVILDIYRNLKQDPKFSYPH